MSLTRGSLLLLLASLLLATLAVTRAQSKNNTARVRNPGDVTTGGAEKPRRTPAELEKNIEECDNSAEVVLQKLFDDADEYEQTEPTIPLAPRPRRGAPGGGVYGSYANYGPVGFAPGYPGGYRSQGDYRVGYGSKGYLDFDKSHTQSPVLTFVKGFIPGKSYVEKGKVVRNYYRHGTYDVALQHYKFIPVVKVVPYTTYKTVGYTDHIATVNDYTANICKDCYHGYPKIDVLYNKGPYNYLTRRLVYLPENYQINDYEKTIPRRAEHDPGFAFAGDHQAYGGSAGYVGGGDDHHGGFVGGSYDQDGEGDYSNARALPSNKFVD